ncbi:hypothetical protein CFC21_110286, partial [Triticum aestivum]
WVWLEHGETSWHGDGARPAVGWKELGAGQLVGWMEKRMSGAGWWIKSPGGGAMVMCGEEAHTDLAAARCRFAYNCDTAVCLDCHGLMFLLEDDAPLPLLPSTSYKV